MTDRRPPEALEVPNDPKKLIDFAKQKVEECRVSIGKRVAIAQEINTFVETGRPDGIRSSMNLLHFHEERLTSHIYSPTMLKFAIKPVRKYTKLQLDKFKVAGEILTDTWENNNIDMLFGEGVQAALRYGCCLMKQWVERSDTDGVPTYNASLVMPWQFAVYREDLEALDRQPAFVESNMLSLPEIWKRIYHFEDARKLFERITTGAQSNIGGVDAYGFLNQVFSTSQLQTGVSTPYLPKPGGIINMNPAPQFNLRGPQIGIDTAMLHELWVWDGDDYCTIQYIEPDILIAPRVKKSNLLAPGSKLQPYTVIRPNGMFNNFWGRSEAEDLMELQNWISETAMDIKRLSGLQVDKILGFTGDDGITDETYGQMRDAGYVSLGPGSSITDLTPPLPPTIMQVLSVTTEFFDKIGGFGNILDGGGESGVRSGNHAQTLLKTASPTLRDRSLLAERQCAQAAERTFNLMKIKDAQVFWTDPEKVEETSFTLGDLPEDHNVVVDSHSSSPIFADDHMQLVLALAKFGIIDGHSVIELLNLPQSEMLQRRLSDKERQQAEFLQQLQKSDPVAFEKLVSKGHK